MADLKLLIRQMCDNELSDAEEPSDALNTSLALSLKGVHFISLKRLARYFAITPCVLALNIQIGETRDGPEIGTRLIAMDAIPGLIMKTAFDAVFPT